jgi:hypothetical protein
MTKLEHVYETCTTGIIEVIDEFWKGFDIPKKKLSIDTDTLQGILIYIVARVKYP